MKRIYTRTGDRGTTGIHGGQRVDKDDIRIEANGCIDELNAAIGIIRSLLPAEHAWQEMLRHIQYEIMTVMSHVATPSAIREKNPNILSGNLAAYCEQQIDRMAAQLEDNSYFVLPGSAPVSAQCHFARTVARRSERRLWTLNRKDPLPHEILAFINRLSDLLFVMARLDMQQQNLPEERWQSFAYKHKRTATETPDEKTGKQPQ
ncbi:MAG: cob(I)yrinic acid a,c-diamide adenosyltransferase [Mediterranea sp.]|jgi:ATP:cob(I)alamin adenosyltransferase|nr:cob(I)yrinic acid a,c-diamide adenosyltransferase [Mediterranea sp.]